MTMNIREDEFGVENNLKVLCSIINDTYSSTVHISIKRLKKKKTKCQDPSMFLLKKIFQKTKRV